MSSNVSKFDAIPQKQKIAVKKQKQKLCSLDRFVKRIKMGIGHLLAERAQVDHISHRGHVVGLTYPFQLREKTAQGKRLLQLKTQCMHIFSIFFKRVRRITVKRERASEREGEREGGVEGN
jgi:hypothetical protein